MNKKTYVLFTLLLIIASLATLERVPTTHGISTVTLGPPTDDSHIEKNNPNTNYGSSTIIHTRGYKADIRRGYLKYSLSSLPPGIKITSAKVYLYVKGGDDSPNPVAAYEVSDSWTEDTITWTNAPSPGSAIVTITVGASGQWYSWEIGSYAQSQYDGDKVLSVVIAFPDDTVSTDSSRHKDISSKEDPTVTNRPYLEVTYTYLPTIDDVALIDADIGTQGCLAQKKAYTFRVRVTDQDGPTDINYLRIDLDPTGVNLSYKWVESTDTFSEVNDPSGYCSISSTSADSSYSGYQWTLYFKLTFAWSYPDENLHSIKVYTVDDAGAIGTNTSTNKYYVENDLIFSGLTVNDYRVNPSQTLTFSGIIYYQGTSITPPNGNYNVKIKLAGVQKGSTYTTLVSGAFSISDVTAESTVASYSYTVESSYMASAGSFPAVIVDRIKVSSYTVSDSRANINDNVNIDATLVYEYDSTAVTTGTITINGDSATHIGSGVYRTPKTSSTVTSVTYNTVAGSESTYGLNTVNQNSKSTTVIWDRIQYVTGGVSDSRADVGSTQTIWYTAKYEYDNVAFDNTKGTFTIGGSAATWSLVNSRWELSVTGPSAPQLVNYAPGHTDTTYGITASNNVAGIQSIIWDRLEVYGYGTSDDRADVSSGVDYWWKLRYDYDDVVFDSSKGTVTIGGSAATWDAINNRWHRTVTLPLTPQSYSLSADFADTTYGLTARAGVTSQSVIADRLELFYVGFDDSRVNVGSAVEVRFKVRYDYDDVVFDNTKGTVNIEGGVATWDATNGWWERSIVQSFSVGSNLYDVDDLTFTDSMYGLTAKTGTASGSVITDRIKITGMGNDDGRRDVGTIGTFWATATLEYDNHVLGSGDSLAIKGISMTWSAINSRFEATDSRSTVGAVTYNTFTSGNEVTYGITAGTMAGYSTTIIWDRFEFVSISVDDSRISVGSTFELRYKIRYDYDDVAFDSSKGSVSGFTWDSVNSWWDKTVTGSSSVTSTNYDETYISITDSTYGLMAKQDVAGVDVITDRIEVYYQTLDDSRVNVGGNIEFRVKARLDYDNHELGSGDSLVANFGALSWDVANSWFDGTRSQGTVGDYTFQASSGSEATYGITAIWVNAVNPTGVWDRVQVQSYTVADSRVNINTNVNIDVLLHYDYDNTAVTDGTVTINGVSATHQGSGTWRITQSKPTVQGTTYNTVACSGNTHGITVVDQNSKSQTVVWDRIRVYYLKLDDSRVNGGANIEVRAKARLDYDNHELGSGDSLTFNSGVGTWDTSNGWFEGWRSQSAPSDYTFTVTSASEATYGITEVYVAVSQPKGVWDQVKVTLTPNATTLYMGQTVQITVSLVLDYDESTVTNCSYNINRNGTAYNNPHTTSTFTDSRNTVGKWVYDFTSITDNTYGITAFVDPPLVTVVWKYCKLTIIAREWDNSTALQPTSRTYIGISNSSGTFIKQADASSRAVFTGLSGDVKYFVLWENTTNTNSKVYEETISSISLDMSKNAKCKVWSLTVNAKDDYLSPLQSSVTTIYWTFPNGTSKLWSGVNTKTFKTMNGTAYLSAKWQNSWVYGNTSHPLADGTPTTINAQCKVDRISWTFKDNSGIWTLNPVPSSMVLECPNGTRRTLTSYSSVLLQNGTYYVRGINWQGGGVVPSPNPSYTFAGTSGYSWTINGRVYSTSFSSSFKDSSGSPLYTAPSSFKLVCPNSTITVSLPVGSYYLQNGSFTWYQILWQGTDVVPSSATFDPTNGNPSVNCRIYSGYVRVHESSGAPIPDVTVTLLWPNENVYRTYQTDGTGSTPLIFQIPAGSYILQVLHDSSPLSTTIAVNQNFDIRLLIGLLYIPYDGHTKVLSYTTNTEVLSYSFNQTFGSLLIKVKCTEDPGFFSAFLTDAFLDQLGVTIDSVHTLLDGALINHTVHEYPNGYLLTVTYPLCSHDVEVVFSNATLAATLTDSNMAPLDGAHIRVYRGQSPIGGGYTDGGGQIVLTNLPPGHYTITTDWLGVPVKSDQLTITGSATYSTACPVYALRAEVIDVFSDFLSDSSVTVRLPDGTVLTSGVTGKDGVVMFSQLPVGDYTVVANYFGFSISVPVSLTENRTVRLQIPILNIYTTLFLLTVPTALGYAFYQTWIMKRRRMRVLFVCSDNSVRAPTAVDMLKDRKDLKVRSAGTLPSADAPLTEELVKWADKILVMENEHKDYIVKNYPEAEAKTVVLNVEDRYKRDDPALKEVLKQKLEILWPAQ